MKNLLHQTCSVQNGPSMNDTDIQHHLQQVSAWRMNEGAIEKTFSFKNYHETMAFVNALAWVAHTEDHHPDLAVSYNRCVVRFNTHSVKGISINDFICAAKADALITFVG